MSIFSKQGFLFLLIREVRPRQWIKNLLIFAPIIFGKKLFEVGPFYNSVIAFFVFCFAISFTYIINDIVDIKKDKIHPIKRNRPIASGKLSITTSLIFAFIFLAISFVLALAVNIFLFYMIVGYVLLQLLYSFILKNYIIIDALTVSMGFILRVFAGGVASATSISSWLILTIIGGSLLLAFGKRRAEKTILQKHNIDLKTRETLKHYPDTLLDSMISTASSFTIIAYSWFAFQTSPSNATPAIVSSVFPSILASPKWMMLSIPIVIYGVARYLYVIYEKKDGESPERVLYSDKPLLYSVIIWGLIMFVFYYILGTVNL